MNILALLSEPWRRVFDFSGRSRRREFLIFVIEATLGVFIIFTLSGANWGAKNDAWFDSLPSSYQTGLGVVCLIWLFPALSLQVRRLHDQNRRGWWLLLNLIPAVGHMITLVMMLFPGSESDNNFGHNPRLPTGKHFTF